MFKIVIADDKSFEREKIKNILDWNRYGVEIVGEAKNGREALELCLRHRPEMLITDIKMPVMTGIELTRAVTKSLPDLHIIYLSSYDEFQYAQQAIELNVRSYLLKPYSEQDIIDVLMRALEQIVESTHRARRSEFQSNLIEGNLELLRQAFFLEVIRREVPMEGRDFWSKAGVLGLQFCNDSFLLLGVRMEHMPKPILQRRPKPAQAVGQLLNEGLPPGVSEYHLIEDERQLLVMLNLEDGQSGQVQAVAAQLTSQLTEGLAAMGYTAQVRASGLGYSHTSWGRLYREVDAEHVTGPVSAYQATQQVYEAYLQVEPEVVRSLGELRCDTASQLLGEVVEQAIALGLRAIHLAKVCLSFALAVNSAGREGQAPVAALGEQVGEILALESPGDVLNWMHAQLNAAEQRMGSYKRKWSAQVVEKVYRIIEEDYGKGVDVAEISARVYLSQNYLRSVFKESTGQSLSTYLSEYRVEKACELLRSTDAKVTEIPEMVGLAGSPYFFFLFKKATGLTPGEYRLRHTGQ